MDACSLTFCAAEREKSTLRELWQVLRRFVWPEQDRPVLIWHLLLRPEPVGRAQRQEEGEEGGRGRQGVQHPERPQRPAELRPLLVLEGERGREREERVHRHGGGLG